MGFADPFADRRLLHLQGADDITAYPTTHEGWQDRYLFLLDAYHGETYSVQLVKQLKLFRAYDDDGKLLALTRRLHREIIFIVDVAKAALGLEQVTLEKPEGITDEEYETAQRIWRRSRPDDQGAVWSLLLACCGDLFIEPARVTPGDMRVSLVHYPPESVYTEYDMVTKSRITKAIISSEVRGEAEVDAEGHVTEESAQYTHQRLLTPTNIKVEAVLPPGQEGEDQRRLDKEASGPHGLGIVPMVHVRCIPTKFPEHSLPVTHGIERGLAEMDSIASQMSAVGDRFANPKPYLFGAKLTAASEVVKFGRWLNVFGKGADKVKAGYIEPTMAGMRGLQDSLERLIRDIRLTFPEFLFVGGGSTANLSAESLRLLATMYIAKYAAIRSRYYGGLERAHAIGVAMERREAYDPDRHPVKIEGPSLLPADIKAELDALVQARAAGGIRMVDVVRRLQALGLADNELSAEEYLELLEEETGELQPEDEAAVTEPPPAADESADLADTAINGAQITGLLEVLQKVSDGLLTEDAAVKLLVSVFPSIDLDEARQIVAGALPAEEDPGPAVVPTVPSHDEAQQFVADDQATEDSR